jgi:OmpA-OmpF porin, OOP family
MLLNKVMKKHFTFFLLITLALTSLYAQSENLVINGSFHRYYRCPQSFNQYNRSINTFLQGWFSVNRSTPDFFHRCSKNTDVGVPANFAGQIEPLSGDGYIGLILRVDPRTYQYTATYSEHITGILERPLKKNQMYCFSMSYAYAQNSGMKTNSIGVYFSEHKPIFDDIADTYDFQPQLILHPDTMLTHDSNWNKLMGQYVSKGNERYITIGNYQPLSASLTETNTPQNDNDTRFFAYYFIDDVWLSENTIPCETQQLNMVTPTLLSTDVDTKQTEEVLHFRVGSSHILRNVFFDFEKSILTPESYTELNKVVAFLTMQPDLHIKITGHTDAIGVDTYNMILSESRAKAVFEYFYESGISLQRMSYEGAGSSNPIADNSTDYGRQLNRRVEIIFFKP